MAVGSMDLMPRIMVTRENTKKLKMQFFLECGSRCGLRTGKLVWATSSGVSAPPLATPLCLLYSRGGAVPNLTRDLEEKVIQGVRHVTGSTSSAEAVMLTMPTMYMKYVSTVT